MDHNNSSSSSDPFDDSIIDGEFLQQLLNNMAPASHHHHNHHQHHHHHVDAHQALVTAAPSPPVDDDHGGGGQDNDTDKLAEARPSQHVRNAAAGGCGGGRVNKGKDKGKAVDVERRRRQEMAALHRSLRSHLPAEYIRGKRSISDHLQEAVKYIRDLEGGIKELGTKKDDLLMMRRSAGRSSNGSSDNNNGSNQEYVNVIVNPCKEGFVEVNVSTCALYINDEGNQQHQRPSLSKVLHILSREGLSVINCVSSRVANNFIHSIKAQVDNGRDIDVCLLQHRLTGYL